MANNSNMVNNTENNMENNGEISLRPAWYGKINWGNWRTINPKMVEYYEKNKTISIAKYWGEFISPSYDEIKEYIKSINKYNSTHSLEFDNRRKYYYSRTQKNKYSRNRLFQFLDIFLDI